MKFRAPKNPAVWKKPDYLSKVSYVKLLCLVKSWPLLAMLYKCAAMDAGSIKDEGGAT